MTLFKSFRVLWAGDLNIKIASHGATVVLLARIWLAVTGIFDNVTIVLNQRLCMQSSHSNSLQRT